MLFSVFLGFTAFVFQVCNVDLLIPVSFDKSETNMFSGGNILAINFSFSNLLYLLFVLFSLAIGISLLFVREYHTLPPTTTILTQGDRFVDETTSKLGAELVILKDGRDIWQVFKDVRYLGNSRIAPCTRILKQEPAKKWIKENYNPDEVILYVGIDWTEIHRLEKVVKNWVPYKVLAPMCQEPLICKNEMLDSLSEDGIKIPRLYEMGFSHNNCGGFCVKAGQGHFANLFKKMPERYAYHEQKEQEMIKFLGINVAILKRTKNKVTMPLSLKKLREEIINRPEQIDMYDVGGCGCFIDD